MLLPCASFCAFSCFTLSASTPDIFRFMQVFSPRIPTACHFTTSPLRYIFVRLHDHSWVTCCEKVHESSELDDGREETKSKVYTPATYSGTGPPTVQIKGVARFLEQVSLAIISDT
jgi:hypothetical protein